MADASFRHGDVPEIGHQRVSEISTERSQILTFAKDLCKERVEQPVAEPALVRPLPLQGALEGVCSVHALLWTEALPQEQA